ncbi:MAG TPA: hypothetical protein VI542_31165 [Candidatus Tectomicrobia bacterium]
MPDAYLEVIACKEPLSTPTHLSTAMARLLILSLCLVLSSCGHAPQPPPAPPPTEADEGAAMEALLLCFYNQVRAIDDRSSDARAIAEAVFLACEQACHTAITIHWHLLVARGALAPDTEAVFFTTMQSSMKRRVLGAVLDYRRSGRE